jgi:hypothetical protein
MSAQPIAIFDGDAAHLVFAQAHPIGLAGEGLHVRQLRDGTGRIVVFAEQSGRTAVVPWEAIVQLAVQAGLTAPPAEQKH